MSVKIEFGSLAGFPISGEDILTLQADQLNVIVHHIHIICTGQTILTHRNQLNIPFTSQNFRDKSPTTIGLGWFSNIRMENS